MLKLAAKRGMGGVLPFAGRLSADRYSFPSARSTQDLPRARPRKACCRVTDYRSGADASAGERYDRKPTPIGPFLRALLQRSVFLPLLKYMARSADRGFDMNHPRGTAKTSFSLPPGPEHRISISNV